MPIKQGYAVGLVALFSLASGSVHAQDNGPSHTFFGTSDLLEMPTAESAERSDISATFSYSGSGGYKTSFSYQLTDRLAGAFRYAVVDQYRIVTDPDVNPGTYETFDRSFDLEYRLTNESTYLPAIAVGLRDFLGTGRFSSEYVVASKSFGPNLIVSTGLGWGRMGTNNGFSNPLGVIDSYFDDRPVFVDREFADEGEGNGGLISGGQFFRGDAAIFGGLEYQISPKFGFKAEYSSNSYPMVTFTPAVDYKSPLNFGLTYRPNNSTELNLAYLYGSEISIGISSILNPEKRPVLSGLDSAPAPLKVRPQDARAATTWDQSNEPALRAALAQLLLVEGITLDSLEVSDRQARVRYSNAKFRSEAQAIGRVSRMMSQIMPASIEIFVLEPMQRGMAVSATTLRRSDLERLENTVGASEAILESASIGPVGPDAGLLDGTAASDKWQWGIGPYVALVLFDASGPVKADVGLQFDGRYELNKNLVISGSVTQSALGERPGGAFFDNPNDYENVRTDGAYFGRDGTPNLQHLTLSHYGRLAPNVYSRVSLGYLEWMHGGVSAEVLWKPVGSRLALGAEVNYTAMRNRDMGFKFDEYDYQVATGHLSAYYDFGKGFQGKLDVGRYLAGDWGATFALDREFQNGWRVGGYFTLTDMPFDQFGEGSFDKGIRVTIPYDYFIGSPTRKDVSTTLQSLSRDGGARLMVDGRLYETVRSGHEADLTDSWGRFWR